MAVSSRHGDCGVKCHSDGVKVRVDGHDFEAATSAQHLEKLVHDHADAGGVECEVSAGAAGVLGHHGPLVFGGRVDHDIRDA